MSDQHDDTFGEDLIGTPEVYDESGDDPDQGPHPEATRLASAMSSAPISSDVPVANAPAPTAPGAGAARASRWRCTAPGCGATWTTDPGPFHTHDVRVPGSKSRVTHQNHPIERVEG